MAVRRRFGAASATCRSSERFWHPTATASAI
jgi:hypothetical protein